MTSRPCRLCGHAWAAHSWSGQCKGDKVFGPIVCHCPGWQQIGACAGTYSRARSRLSCVHLRNGLRHHLALCPACVTMFGEEASP